MTDEEEFFAWLDGELDDEAAARVAARVESDPALGKQAREHRALSARMRGAFDPLMKAPVPDRLASSPLDLGVAREERAARRGAGRLPQWAAMAATLALGTGLGTMLGGRDGPQAPVSIENGQMVASSALRNALETQLASLDQQGFATRIGLTFRNGRGALCRSFEGIPASGVACRSDEEWRIEGLLGTSGGRSTDEYRMASGGDPRLAALIEATAKGEPLDAPAEQAAQARGWR